jgi:glucan phosphoethanolaminetransferase (alkaline phosphatase superfamily)
MAGKDQHSAFGTTLLIVAGVLLLAILSLIFRFSRVPPAAFWVLVLGWEILFVWYAWFSPVAPFVFHEAHTLDAGGAAKEATAHYVKAGILFGLLFVWFLSLPFARAKWKDKAAHL